ncbi:MAG: SDR family oxidoreductase [Acidobacteriota bacterium]|nr:SDR family oxidoreductase [Acidobacteriota bacterium]
MQPDTILITGASSDIGLALIRQLCGTAQQPVVLAHANASTERLEALRDELQLKSLHLLQADLASAESTLALAAEVTSRFGTPNQVVHLPGLKLRYERFTKWDEQHFATDLHIQLHSAILLMRRLLPAMAKLPSAQVVFLLSSVTRALPPRYMSMYTVVKHAQLGLMRALASEYSGTSVSVNAVSPGMVETRFLDGIPEVVRQMAASSTPRGRNATPQDVANAIQFLLSPGSGYLTGVELPVTGGATL